MPPDPTVEDASNGTQRIGTDRRATRMGDPGTVAVERAPSEDPGDEPRILARVLLVDDDREALAALEQTAGRAGLDVVATTNDGEHAIDLARVLEPDLALIDWDMPHFGGALTARLMKHYAPGVTPVLVLDEQHLTSASAAGRRFASMPKTADAAELLGVVLMVLPDRDGA
jgi:DNA-binding response OmpR family regulator